MNTSPAALATHQLRFQFLFATGRAFAFPCDATGAVDIDSLSDRARHNYFYARTFIGREFSVPAVLPADFVMTH